jgi:isocitrate lyase
MPAKGAHKGPYYNCSRSFNWRKHLSDAQIAGFQRDLARLGYRFQFITLA